MKRGLGIVVVGAVFATTIASADAADQVSSLNLSATGTALAEPVWAVPEVVTVNRPSALSADVIARTITAAQAAYGTWALSRGASVGMHSVRRGAAFVQEAAPGFNFPMSITALPTSAVAQLMSRGLAGVLSSGAVVMGHTTASLRGAEVGDVVDIVSAQGPVVSFGIGAIVDDAVIGGTEILMSSEQADAIGVTTETRIIVWGFQSRDLLDQLFAAAGLFDLADVRIRHSWDPPDPDSTIGMAAAKALLGEFAYRVLSNGVDVAVSTEWEAAHMPAEREVLVDAIPIRARCNVAIRDDLRAALTEVAAVGLASQINVTNANTYGGCYYPRFNRVTGNIGFLSRHSWGEALDTNTDTNPQGGTPRMNCDVVRIFRKHGFAWGGNFPVSDGMHFEWVGAPRDQYQYPSKYCPNLPSAASATQVFGDATAGASLGLSTMLIDDGG